MLVINVPIFCPLNREETEIIEGEVVEVIIDRPTTTAVSGRMYVISGRMSHDSFLRVVRSGS